MLKNVFVHIPSEASSQPVVAGATSLAASRGAHLDAISVGYKAATSGSISKAAVRCWRPLWMANTKAP